MWIQGQRVINKKDRGGRLETREHGMNRRRPAATNDSCSSRIREMVGSLYLSSLNIVVVINKVWIPQQMDVSMIINKGVNSLSQITFHIVTDTSGAVRTASKENRKTRTSQTFGRAIATCHCPIYKLN
jgi:hypothetical protein